MVVPGVDLHLAMVSSWIKDIRAYATAERYTDLDIPLYANFFDAATSSGHPCSNDSSTGRRGRLKDVSKIS